MSTSLVGPRSRHQIRKLETMRRNYEEPCREIKVAPHVSPDDIYLPAYLYTNYKYQIHNKVYRVTKLKETLPIAYEER